MPHYLLQWSFAPDQAKALTEKPQDREGPARQVIEGFGGRLLAYYFMLGEHDGIGIAELPDNETAAALSMRLGASGAFASFATHALLTSAEAQRAMQKVKTAKVAYKPPSG